MGMCTVMTIDQANLFGRTMDFPPRTPWHLTYLPVGYSWQPANTTLTVTNRRAILGGMRVVGPHYLIGDGVNDAGLVCAELFFPVAADYPVSLIPGAVKLTPQDVVGWLLGSHSTVSEVAADLKNVTVINEQWYDGNYYPFHWLLMDKTGTYVIEPLAGKLTVQEDPLGVLTNTPDLMDQYHRVRDFLVGYPDKLTTQLKNYRGSQPTGTNSVQRFIRAAVTRWQTKTWTPQRLQKFLADVSVPHTPAHAHNYTHYQAIIDRQTLGVSFHDLHSGQMIQANLSELIKRGQSPLRFGQG